MEKISVIIPMYNSEAYIVQCLRSVMRQTYRELEILLVDDGSEDEGPLICRQLALADNRIRVIRQERGGVSRARNRGLDEASGEYIFFLDSDDAIHPELIEALQGAAREDEAKLLFCEFARADNAQMEAVPESGQGEPRGRIIFQKAEGEKTEEWFHVSHTKELAGIGGKMIKRDAVGDLRFDESLKKGEDTFFLYQLAEKQIPMVCLPKKWYYYRIHPQSTIHSFRVVGSRDFFESSKRIRDREYEKGTHPSYTLYWERMATQQMCRSYQMMRKTGCKDKAQELKRTAEKERSHPMYPRMNLSNRLLFALCFHCYPLYPPIDRAARILVEWKESRK